MKTTIVNIKTDPRIKKEAKKIAGNLGFTLSGVINAFLREFIRAKSVDFSLNNEKPSAYLKAAIREAEKEKKQGKFYSFNNVKDAIDFLDK